MSGFVQTASPIEVVVVAGSAGVVPIYGEVFSRLDRWLPAPVVLVQHRRPGEDLVSEVQRLRSEPAIRKQALDAGLGQLGAPVVVQPR